MYKKQRPMTAHFPAKQLPTSDICTSEVAEKPGRPKTAISRHTINQLDNRFSTNPAIPLKKYERLNDANMDPVVVKAVRSFAKQKKIVTHDTIIDIGEKVARAKEQKHKEELATAVKQAVEEEREKMKKEFKLKMEQKEETLTSTWIEKIDNTDQIAEDAAKKAAAEVRSEMEEKIHMLEQVHVKLTESAVKEALQNEQKEWLILEKQRLRQARIEWESDLEQTLAIRLQEQLNLKHVEWGQGEERRIKELAEELKEVFKAETEDVRSSYRKQVTQLDSHISELESQIVELECQLMEANNEAEKTKSVLQDTRFHFSQFIGEVPGFESDYFKSSAGFDTSNPE